MSNNSNLSFLGIPIDSVGTAGGTELAPQSLRELGMIDCLGGEDLGDLPVSIRDTRRDPVSGIIGYGDVLDLSNVVRAAVRQHLSAGRRLFLAGGCCTQMIGAMAGTRDALGIDGAGIVYLDGHLDLYDGISSPSGEAADIPLATMLGHGPATLIEAMNGPSILPENVALLGYRDLLQATGHGSLIPEDFGPGFIHADTPALRGEGMAAAGRRIESRFADRRLPFWLFLDLDVLDPAAFPATDCFVDGGLTWPELADLMRPFMASPMLLGAVLTCYNPEKDKDRRCGKAIVQHFEALIRTA